MRQRHHVANDAEPGTGTQYYMVACTNPEDEPRLADEIERLVEEEAHFADEATLMMTQWSGQRRTWQCGGEYWDKKNQDIVELDAVVRKSHWCHTGEIEDAPIKLQFRPDHLEDFEYDPEIARKKDSRMDPTERFLPRHNVPFRLP